MRTAMTKRPETKLDADFGFDGIDQVHGVTCDGQLTWFSSDGRLIGVDVETGERRKEFEVPADAGTAFDGQHLWQVGGDKIRQVHAGTGKVLHTIDAPEGGTNISGMAYADGFLWLGGWKDKRILKVDAKTGAVVKVIETDRFVTGVSWTDGQLWHAAAYDGDQPTEIRRVDPESGAEQFRAELPDGVGCSGMEVDPKRNRVWFGDGPRLRSAELERSAS